VVAAAATTTKTAWVEIDASESDVAFMPTLTTTTTTTVAVVAAMRAQRYRTRATSSSTSLSTTAPSRTTRAASVGADVDGYDDTKDDDDDVIAVANDARSSALAVLGFTINDVATLSAEDVRARYRARAKACHPDRAPTKARADEREARSNATIRVRLAYESVMKNLGVMRDGDHGISDDGEALDPFDAATLAKYFDGAERVFVNEFACLGRQCWSSCVGKGAGRFTYADDTGAARYVGDDGFGSVAANAEDAAYVAWIAAEQCPEKCIHFVTEAQRDALRGHLSRAIAGDARERDNAGALIQTLLAQAAYENGRAAGALNSRRNRVATSTWVDWY